MGFFRFGRPNVEELRRNHDLDGFVQALGYEKDASVRRAAAHALSSLRDRRAVEPLVAALVDPEWHVRDSVIVALGELGAPTAVPPLIAALRGGENRAARALERIGAPAVEPLIAVLEDPDRVVRASAAGALGRIGDARAAVPLQRVSREDENRYVREVAAEALCLLSG
jgi:hypothetical protein